MLVPSPVAIGEWFAVRTKMPNLQMRMFVTLIKVVCNRSSVSMDMLVTIILYVHVYAHHGLLIAVYQI